MHSSDHADPELGNCRDHYTVNADRQSEVKFAMPPVPLLQYGILITPSELNDLKQPVEADQAASYGKVVGGECESMLDRMEIIWENLRELDGFIVTVNDNGILCKFPTFVNTPVVNSLGEARTDPVLDALKIKAGVYRKGDTLYRNHLSSRRTRDVFTFQQNGEVKLKMVLPVMNTFFIRERIRTVEMYAPLAKSGLIGFLQISDFKLGATLKNTVCNKEFHIKIPVTGTNCPRIEFFDTCGKKVAMAQGVGRTRNMSNDQMEWTKFQLHYYNYRKNVSVMDKALILAAFNAWASEMIEKKYRQSRMRAFSVLFVFIVVLFFMVWSKV